MLRKSLLLLPFFALCWALVSAGPPDSRHGEWKSYGRDEGGARFSPLKQIDRSNVGRLTRAWTYHTGDVVPGTMSTNANRIAPFEATPLLIDGVLYFSTPSSRVIALDPETGEEIWEYKPPTRGRGRLGAHRGVAYWERGRDRRIVYASREAFLISLDAKTGKPSPGFGDGGIVDLRKGFLDEWPKSLYAVSSPPSIYRDLVIVGSALQESPGRGPSGDVRAFDVRSGKLVWTFHTVPRPGEPGHETWEGDSWKDRSGVNVWSIMSVDTERGFVFLPIGSPPYDFYGGDRKGDNLYGNSLVALDAATGKLRWHFQAVRHDIWDYDLPAQPILIDVHRDGRTVPAVVLVTKMGFVFVFHRETGEPLFPIEDRPVPQSEVPGEATSPTQPFPLKPPQLSRASVSRDELSSVTPEAARFCRELFDSTTSRGMFTPWGLELTRVLPGTLGGATWSGGAFDSRTGLLYVNANEQGAVGRMEKMPEGSRVRYRRTSPWGEYARFGTPEEGWPCVAPPWGTLIAINMNTGEIAWRVSLGVVDELLTRGVPPTGAPNLGGPIVTAGGLVFIAGTSDSRLRAFDSSTGEELWVARLDASGHAMPMTYLGPRDNKQYVVIAAGGGGYFPQPAADTLIAFSLPD